jgi:PcRGLX-like protein central beta sandwich domain/PcRGLX-like protein C-terminal alpha/alpha toroid domain/PcRGLX-like N-terminal RIFT barrel domain
MQRAESKLGRLGRFFGLLAPAVLLAGALGAAEPVTLDWLGGTPPAVPAGVSWGVPWPKGALAPGQALVLKAADGKTVPLQTWTLASWPDGSVKWSGEAIAAGAGLAGPFTIAPGGAAAPAVRVACTEDATGITIDTGVVRARIPKQGANLVESLTVDGRVVAQDGHLIARLEQRSRDAAGQVVREEQFTSRVESAVLEQSGPVRAVVKITGRHEGAGRAWLPFVVRLYFFAGSGEIRLAHTIVFDGDGEKDFLKALGVEFRIPFREELQNRHIRFVGDGSGVWAQPVRMLPGYRPQAGREIGELYAQHLGGQRVPNLAQFDERAREAILSVPVWNEARLLQLGPNGFAIDKRTTGASSWLHVTDGHRSLGLALLGDVSGGLAVGVKDFWQKYPAALAIHDAARPVGRLVAWLWAPPALAMDLRTYDTVPHGLPVNYEDWKPGWGTATGIANTHDLTLWACGAIPSDQQLVAMAHAAAAPPILVCTPPYYHRLQVFGHWSLPDRSTPALRWVEDQVGGLVDFYRHQVDERSWYGFWNFGDIMHNYDFGRHEWRYDVGGWAWANTELMPDMLLWYSFLRTGRADIFRMAEAMTRHTSEVDVYHLGPFAPLGSRHNVNHWGDGAKQPRISHDGIKEFYYFLTTDERVGDLMHEQLGAEATYDRLIRYNGSHYLPTADGGAKLANPRETPAPRPEDLPPAPTVRREAANRLGLEWMCYAMNWTVEWERTGNTAWRDRVIDDMKAMAANIGPDGRLPGGYFDMIFGGPENMFEMEPMYDVPAFWRGWANTCEALGRRVGGNEMTAPRMLAYAAWVKKDPALGEMAWDKLIGTALTPEPKPVPVNGPEVVKPVTDPDFLGKPVGWQQHGVASVQWALNAIETMELARPWLPAWEAAHEKAAH